MMIATLKKCTKATEDVCQIEYDVFMLAYSSGLKKFALLGKYANR